MGPCHSEPTVDCPYAAGTDTAMVDTVPASVTATRVPDQHGRIGHCLPYPSARPWRGSLTTPIAAA